MSDIIYPRSPRETMDGWPHLPRYIDKIRLHLAGKLHADYQPNYGTRGFDKGWLDAAGVSLDDSHSMHMQGMLTEAQLAELEAAKDGAFDKLWLTGMIAHHEGALLMAKDVTDSSNTEVADFAEHVIEDQTGEIAKMKDLLG